MKNETSIKKSGLGARASRNIGNLIVYIVLIAITLMLVLPYHPAERPTEAPDGFDGTYHPDGLESTPKRYTIVRANRIMVDTSDWLVCYVRHGAGNSRKLLEYAEKIWRVKPVKF